MTAPAEVAAIPDAAATRDIARALYPDLDGVEWIPSDDADVFRLSFTSGR